MMGDGGIMMGDGNGDDGNYGVGDDCGGDDGGGGDIMMLMVVA